MIASCLAAFARILTGARAHWRGCGPDPKQRVYFANHTSNLDFVLLWATLPTALRTKTRPVAARDYWTGGVREYFAARVFRAVLIERRQVSRDNNPLAPMLAALQAGDSLIIFPEGTRALTGDVAEFKPGVYHIARARPDVEFVPVYIENLNRVLPKGEVLPVPLLCSVTFGTPLLIDAEEPKADFLARARSSLLSLKPS